MDIEELDRKVKEIMPRSEVTEVEGFAELLSPKARKVYETRQTTVKIELNKPIEGGGYERYLCELVPFAKIFELSDGEENAPQWALQKLADVFSRLVDEGWLDHGVLGPLVQIRLADLPAVPQFIRRVMLCLYPYPTLKVMLDERDPWTVLNAAVGVDAFAPEGRAANPDGWRDMR